MPASSFRCDSCACSSASSSSTPLRIAASSASTALLRDSSSCSSRAATMLSPFSSISRSVCSAASRWVSRCAVAICLALSSNASIVFCVHTQAAGLASEIIRGEGRGRHRHASRSSTYLFKVTGRQSTVVALRGRRRVTPELAERDKLDEGSLRSSTLDEGKTSWQDQLDEVVVVHRVCQPPLIDCVSTCTCTRTMLLG